MEFRCGCCSKVERVTVKETRPYENRPYIKDAYYPASSSTRPYIVEPRQEPCRRDSFPPGYRSDSRERGYYANFSFASPKIYHTEPRYSSLRQDNRSPSPEIRSYTRSRPPPSRSAYSHSESYHNTKSQSQSYSESKSYSRSSPRSGSTSRPPPVPSTYSHSNSYSTSRSKTRSNHRSDSISPPPQPESGSNASNSARAPHRAPTPPPAASIPRRSTAHHETHNAFRSPSPKTKSQPPPKQQPKGHAGTPKFDYKPPKNAIYTEWPVGGYTLTQEEPVAIPITPAPWNGNLSRISRYGLIDCLMKGSKRSFEETKELVDKQFALHAPIYWPDGRRSQSKYEIDEEGRKYEQQMKDKNKNKMP